MLPNVFFANIFDLGAGFTNQIIAFVYAIIYCKIHGKNVLVLGELTKDVRTLEKIPISEIIDMEKMNQYLQDRLGIEIVDKKFVNFDILRVYTEGVDITDEVLVGKKIVLQNDFIEFFENNGNPDIQLIFEYTICGSTTGSSNSKNVYKHHITMNRKNNIFDFYHFVETTRFQFTFSWINSLETQLFNELFINIFYTSKFYEKAAEFAIQNDFLQENEKVNLIHVRVEDDIEMFAQRCKMTNDEYREELSKKYIYLIKKYIDKDSKNIILSYSLENPVIDFLRENGYKYYFVEKVEKERELNALRDILVSDLCNSVFIGNFDLEKNRGSTFSYYIHRRLLKKTAHSSQKQIKTIMLDIEDVKNINERLL